MIFAEEWWLRAATGDKYRLIQSCRKSVSASMPVFATRKLGMRVFAPPPFTRIFEPTINCDSKARAVRIEKTASILKDCLSQLSGHKRVEFVLRPGSDLCLGFIAAGFSVEDANTFASIGPVHADELWAQMHPKTRNSIRSAMRSCIVIKHRNIERFITMSSAERLGNDKTDYATLRRLWPAITAHDAGIILSTANMNGSDRASAIVVWDETTLYYLHSARSIRHHSAGDNALLVWSAIELAESNGLAFDLDGYHSLSALRFCSKFGLAPVARKRVFLNSIAWKLAELGRDALRKFAPARRLLPSSWEGQEEPRPAGVPVPAINSNELLSNNLAKKGEMSADERSAN